jgi:hypothetical protein
MQIETCARRKIMLRKKDNNGYVVRSGRNWAAVGWSLQ